MAQASGAMHVARVVGRYTAKSGVHREYVSHLLRRTFRADGKVRHETLANLSPLPAAAIEAVRASLAGKTLLVAGEDLEVTRSLPHGHVAAVLAQAQRLGLPNLLGPVGRQTRATINATATSRGSAGPVRSWPPPAGGPTPPWPLTSASPRSAPTRRMRRWIGFSSARTPSRPRWPIGT